MAGKTKQKEYRSKLSINRGTINKQTGTESLKARQASVQTRTQANHLEAVQLGHENSNNKRKQDLKQENELAN